MKKCVLYVRVASAEQSKYGVSIEKQIDGLKEFAKEQKLEIAKTYSDFGSARAKRINFEKMLSEISKGYYQGILCWNLDRLSRDIATTARLLDLITKKGVEIITPSGIFSNKPTDKLFMGIFSSVSQFYSERISLRIKEGIAKKKRVIATKSK